MGAGEMGEDTIAKRADGPRANARTEDYDESGRIPSTLERYFALRDDVTLAFLFGSVARGKATGRSDVDVAVYFAGGYNLTTVGGITGDLETLLRRDVDLIVLNEANASVAWAALRGTPLLSEGALVLAPLPVVAGLPVLHSGTAPEAGRASPKSGPSGQWPDFDTPRAITGNPSQKSRAFLHPHLVPRFVIAAGYLAGL